MKIHSKYAILDVTHGRVNLRKQVHEKGKIVPVTITGFITSVYGSDDGVSLEFNVDVDSVEVELEKSWSKQND